MPDHGFYVGYRALPRRHRVFLIVAVPLAVLGMLVGAAGLAFDQPAWGDGFWETGAASEYRGTLSLSPYPMLHVAGESGVTSYLLVEMGKFGSRDRFETMSELDGAAVSVRGRELRRDGRRMIEIDPDGADAGPAVTVLNGSTPAVRWHEEIDEGTTELVGEIVDSKCYLGAMKPGAGRGHKACATLCLSGGIPPVLVVRQNGGGSSYLLLVDETGGGLSDSAIDSIKPIIAERVTLRGRIGQVGSWGVLRIAPARLGSSE